MRCHLRCFLLTPAAMCLPLPASGQGRTHDRPSRSHAAFHQSASLTGTYTRVKRRRDENQSATLGIKQLRADKIKLHLTALWWPTGRSDSPHNGEIEATVALDHQIAVYKSENYRLTLRFQKQTVVVTESGSNPDFGAYVSAAGTYRRASRGRN